jgi:hypothetical protein
LEVMGTCKAMAAAVNITRKEPLASAGTGSRQ